jgi:glycosyltransferase involved in cell wall biosynthesis
MDEKSRKLMSSAPVVSVIMSVYNGEEFLPAAIDSIIGQSLSEWEFIITDDNSNEATRSLLLQYEKDPRIKITWQKNRQGLTRNLNQAIGECRGKYIARMDGDDISIPERFARQVDFLDANPDVAAVATYVQFIDGKGKITGEWPDDRKTNSNSAIRRVLPFRNCLAHPSVMVRKEIMQQYGYNNEQVHSQDWDLWMRLAADHKRIEKIKMPLLLYRVHGSSVTATTNKRSAVKKRMETYRKYLRLAWRKKKFNAFNLVVLYASAVNFVKMLLSVTWRSITNKN